LAGYRSTKGYRGHEVFGELGGKQMQFMCLIYSDPATALKPGTAEFGPFMKGYQDFTETVKNDGKMVHADALQGVDTATCVSVRSGNTQVTDGPFAETKEHLGGYYLLDCTDLDEAVKYAAQIPTSEFGRIEVRPVVVWDS
jgi:hypothetical protein